MKPSELLNKHPSELIDMMVEKDRLLQTARHEIEELQIKLAEAKKASERMDFLIENKVIIRNFVVPLFNNIEYILGLNGMEFRGKTLSETVDNAMEKCL